ncbi:SPOC like C-terminal domain-containing protein [Paraphysoderma sedebokerense]|nr:SPOC like C-terminal domain-containing protein [Paraphysoderma sedebokerense]
MATDGAEGFDHFSVFQPLSEANLNSYKSLINNPPYGEHEVQIIDGLAVGMHEIAVACKHYKFRKEIILITDASVPINKEFADAVMVKSLDEGIEVYILCMGLESEEKSPIKSENEAFLKEYIEKLYGDSGLIDALSVLESVTSIKPKAKRSVAIYKGDLTIGDAFNNPDLALSIPVEIFGKVMKETPQTAKKLSVAARDNPVAGGTRAIHVERTYGMLQEAADQEEEAEAHESRTVQIPQEELIKGFKYGKTLVPLNEVDEDMMRLFTTKGLEIIGTINRSEFRREWELSNTYIVFAQTGNISAAQALSGLARGLHFGDLIAVARYVRRDYEHPKLVALIPRLKAKYEALIMVQIPYESDIRRFTFPPLNFRSLENSNATSVRASKRIRKDNIPTDEQIKIMDEIIDVLDLSQYKDDEFGMKDKYYRVSRTFNPMLHHINTCIDDRAVRVAPDLPDVDPRLKRQMAPIPDIFERSRPLLKRAQEVFGVTKTEPKKKRKNNQEYTDASGEKLDRSKLFAGFGEYSSESTTRVVGNVSELTPLEDFNAMLNDITSDRVEDALKGLGEVIKHAVSDESEDIVRLEQAFQFLKEMRRAALENEASFTFNTIFQEIKTVAKPKFWDLVRDHNLSLITAQEEEAHIGTANIDDTRLNVVTEAQAKQFLL